MTKGVEMDLIEKARIRINHWIQHNEAHEGEYKSFAEELQAAGLAECSRQVLETAKLTSQGSEALRRALKAIE
jgi:hypothetical protein